MAKQLNRNKTGSPRRNALSSSISAEMFKLKPNAEENEAEVIRELSSHFAMIPIGQIERNPDQPRREFDEEALQELSDSINIHGIIQPITVRMMAPSQYQIISGERRWRASKRAGLQEVPAFIRLANDQELLEMALIENIQREDLNAMEVAYSYYRLKNEFELTDEQLAERVGKHRTTVTNYQRLLGLHPAVIEAIQQDTISMGHARVIAGIEDKLLQKKFLDELLAHRWNVRQTEKEAKRYTQSSRGSTPPKAVGLDAAQRKIQDDFRHFFGNGSVKITVEDTQTGRGVITIPFKSHEELTELFKMIEQ